MNYEDRVTKEYVEGLLSGGAKIATGSYVGDGTNGRSIPLPFSPKLMIVFGYLRSGSSDYPAIYFLTQDVAYIIFRDCSSSANHRLSGDQFIIDAADSGNGENLTHYYVICA